MKFSRCFLLIVSLYISSINGQLWSATETNYNRRYRPGEMVFNDEFNVLNTNLWKHEIDFIGGGGDEFQIYDKHSTNSFVQNGVLHVKATTSAARYGEPFLTSGHLKLEGCTAPDTEDCKKYGCCERWGHPNNPLPPIISARLRTKGSFSFRYGRVEVRAKMPSADWTWPAVWFLPEDSQRYYGQWPTSGEIDLLEIKGNRNLINCWSGQNVGSELTASTLHYGPNGDNTGGMNAHGYLNTQKDQGFDRDFHRYQMIWTKDYLRFSVDDREITTIRPSSGGFWELGGFNGKYPNPFNSTNTDNFKMAPFDRKFHFILNVAVGGKGFQGDICEDYPPPWDYKDFYSPQRLIDFWGNRTNWLHTWAEERAAMQVDYIRVYAV